MKSNTIFSILANPWAACVIIAVVVLMIYSNAYQAPFVFDGKHQIENSTKIRDLENFSSLKGFFSHRPLAAFSYALNYRFNRLKPFGYHLVNNMVHVLNGILAYLLALRIFRRAVFLRQRRLKDGKVQAEPRWYRFQNEMSSEADKTLISLMALTVALVFSVHPIQTQAVTYMGQRYTSMAALFYLLSILLFIVARINRLEMSGSVRFFPKVWLLFTGSAVCGVLALLCKENAATLPGILLMTEFFLFDRTGSGWKRKLIWLLPLFMGLFCLVIYFFAVTRGLKFGNLLEDVSILTRETRSVSRWSYLCTQFNVLVIYVRLLFFPAGQNVDYMYPFKTGFFDGMTPLAFVFLLGILGAGFWNARKRPVVCFGIFWFLITLSIESSIFTISDALFEHRLYLPSFGFALTVVYCIFEFFFERKGWAVFSLVLIVCALGTAAHVRNEIWTDPMALWADVVEKSPLNHRARNNLGTSLNDAGDPVGAIREFMEAVRLKPDFALAHNNLGNALMRQRRLNEAKAHLKTALKMRPNLSVAHSNLGIVMGIEGDFENALKHLKRAAAINPRSGEIRCNLGTAYLKQGNAREAVIHFKEAARLQPHNAVIQGSLGQALLSLGEKQAAKRHFQEALRLNPKSANVHATLGFVLKDEGDYDSAVRYFRQALEINPRLRSARIGLGQARRLLQKN